MRHSTIVGCSLAFFGTGIAHASMPPQPPEKPISAAAAMAKNNSAEEAVREVRALRRAQDHAVKNYRHNMSRMAAAEKKKQADAAAAGAVHAQREKKEAAALAKAQEYAVKNYRRNMSRIAAAEKKKQAQAAAAEAARAQRANEEAEALAKAQDRVVAYYKRSLGIETSTVVKRAPRGVEKLTCFTGIQDRHARIGVQVVNGKVDYFAFYSKWKPRTCSIDAGRDSGQWEDNGTSSKLTFVDGKGVLVIHRTDVSYRFDFKNVDRMRYCGMDGKINGSLTVTRGERKCIVKGIMDGHQG